MFTRNKTRDNPVERHGSELHRFGVRGFILEMVSCIPVPSMEAATGRGSLIVFSPSSKPQCRGPPTSLTAGASCLWRRHGKTRLPLLRAAYTQDAHGGDELVDVIGIGSRKYSVIDFCLASPSVYASSFRFWTIYSRDQKKVQLLERCRSKDEVIRNVEFPLSQHSHQPTIILLASTGYGLDHIAAMDLLNNVKSVGGLAIAIVLKPFSFEGHRRQKEVDDLVNNLKSCLNFYIVVEADSFFKVEVGTLAEALESANNTVLLALNTFSSMISKVHSKILNTSDGEVKDIKPSEVVKVLERYGELKIYHGAGYNVNAAIMQAHCPFFDFGLKDFNGLAIMTLTCACNIGEIDLPQIIPSFRQITGYTGDIIFSKICEPNLEQKLVATTILIVSKHNEKMVPQRKGFFSSLLQNLPSFFHIFQVDSTEAANTSSNSSLGDTVFSSGSGSTSDLDLTAVTYPLELIPENEFPDMLKNLLLRKESCQDSSRGATDPVETNLVSDNNNGDQNYGETLDIVGTMHSSHHIGPAFHVAELWAKKCFQSRTKVNDKVEMSSLPVGIRASKLSPDCNSYCDHPISENSDHINQEISIPFSGEIAADMSKQNSVISVRAAMMLEAERGSPKGWNSIVEIQYRGGIYRGRCQGGLPDGKGRLTFMDGSFYEGFWKCGKRSGLGTFCYSNGDLFRGPWRDDLMHGKGWFYFHTGDRWFANFWRGKANGEGRFFSKNGSIFFGIFRDGWRHGQSVCIDADGSRWAELWEDGVLVDRKADN